MSQPHKPPFLTITLGVVAVVAISYLGYQHYSQTKQIEMLLQERNFFLNESANTQRDLDTANQTAFELEQQLTDLKDELEELADDYQDERNRNEDFEDQIRDLAGTLGDLDKLAKTDEELLQKYSKVYFLNENYIPERLVQIDDKYVLPGKKDQYFHAQAINNLEDLLDAGKKAGYDLKIVSAYRSFDEQAEVKNGHAVVYGSGANAFSADQGYSEHQLGTTLDITTPEVGGAYTSFAETEAYQWLLDNGYKYGFVLSYPEGNSFYIFEPWHWRFVGEDLARDLHRADDHFYDWDQRDIDQYLLTIFD